MDFSSFFQKPERYVDKGKRMKLTWNADFIHPTEIHYFLEPIS